MTIELTKDVIKIWRLQLTETSDWMAALSAVPGHANCFDFTYRFRYYREKEPWGDKDIKNWYEGRIREPRDEVLAKLDDLVRKLEDSCGNIADTIVMKDGDVDGFLEEMSKYKWCHKKILS